MECERCGKTSEYGGYAVEEGKNLCPECWTDYINLKNSFHRLLMIFWAKSKGV